ncbi:FAD-dependent oxidoreductase [Xanthobacter agilis]|uniref:Cation diffusion facilitator CzcD-associated flavoprotein CzcO n=1 Tax=Xanthobacter agilis TaxID=47492 RepID=A0ABU0LIB7_XANAG|nr:FAD-dependent oxidoreductase [Xanthobacter agilis]MDQ0506869.1 cation diffusion facilitator CzcD-associated flavoprotein CzcO [Xanthobacter agilis]
MTAPATPDINALARLAAQAQADLARIGETGTDWVPPAEGIDHNVVVVGAGQSGLSAAFGLRRAGIGRVNVVDAAPAGQEGIWRGPARMTILRTPKVPPGPELGLPSLSFQAWYEAAYGAEAYAALPTVPREIWADYVAWFRSASGVEVRNGVTLARVEPQEGRLRLHFTAEGKTFTETTRKLVLATGIAGAGGPFIPDVVANLPGHLYAHTHAFDPKALAGRRVAILGSAASAFDAAGALLEAGAGTVDLFSRGADLARGSAMKPFGFFGAWEHFHALPDADRWAVMAHFRRRASFPPPAAVKRAVAHANFRIHLDAGWRAATPHGEGVRITLNSGATLDADFILLGTGYQADARLYPPFADFAPAIARWSDKVAVDAADVALASAPYLGPAFELVEREPDAAPFLADIHFLAFSAMTSTGRPVGDIASLRHNIPRAVAAIGRDLFVADRAKHLARFLAPVGADDLPRDLYAGAIAAGDTLAAAE